MINTHVFSAAEKQKEGEGDGKRDENLSYMRHGVCVRVCLCMHVCLAVMTLCLWAPTEYVYPPQQHRAKIDDASLTRTHTHTHLVQFLFFLSFALIASLLHSPFHTRSLAPVHITYSSLTHSFLPISLLSLFSLPLVLQYAY